MHAQQERRRERPSVRVRVKGSKGSESLRRSFLFLQGVCSPFFSTLADQLRADGHKVFKVNFNFGDVVYWGARSAWNYRSGTAGLRAFLDEKYRTFSITDQVSTPI